MDVTTSADERHDSSVSLEGAANTRVGYLGHAAFLTDVSVCEQVRDFVR